MASAETAAISSQSRRWPPERPGRSAPWRCTAPASRNRCAQEVVAVLEAVNCAFRAPVWERRLEKNDRVARQFLLLNNGPPARESLRRH